MVYLSIRHLIIGGFLLLLSFGSSIPSHKDSPGARITLFGLGLGHTGVALLQGAKDGLLLMGYLETQAFIGREHFLSGRDT